ncbi:MAG: hypothetical protein Q9207_006188 [Kuettlingeria erythrocarpa]
MPSHTTKSTPAVPIPKRDPFFTPRRSAPPPPPRHNQVTTFTTPLTTDPFFIPRRPAPPIPRRPERAMSATGKAVWAMALEQAFAGGLRWTLRKNRERLHINSNIVEDKVTDGSIIVEF